MQEEPAGAPEQESDTFPEKPFWDVTVTSKLAFSPAVTDCELGEAEIPKPATVCETPAEVLALKLLSPG